MLALYRGVGFDTWAREMPDVLGTCCAASEKHGANTNIVTVASQLSLSLDPLSLSLDSLTR